MAKGMELDGETSLSPGKRVGRFVIKLFGSALLLAFSYLLLFSDSKGFFVFSGSPASEMPAVKVSDSPSREKADVPYTRLPEMALHVRKGDSLKGSFILISARDPRMTAFIGACLDR